MQESEHQKNKHLQQHAKLYRCLTWFFLSTTLIAGVLAIYGTLIFHNYKKSLHSDQVQIGLFLETVDQQGHQLPTGLTASDYQGPKLDPQWFGQLLMTYLESEAPTLFGFDNQVLLRIKTIETDFKTAYWQIFLNHQPLETSLKAVPLGEQTYLTFMLTPLKY